MASDAMQTETGYVVASVAVALAITVVLSGLVLVATGSWHYAGGTGLFALEAGTPIAAWLVDRMMSP